MSTLAADLVTRLQTIRRLMTCVLERGPVALDGYNFGASRGWMTFQSIFSDAYAALGAICALLYRRAPLCVALRPPRSLRTRLLFST